MCLHAGAVVWACEHACMGVLAVVWACECLYRVLSACALMLELSALLWTVGWSCACMGC